MATVLNSSKKKPLLPNYVLVPVLDVGALGLAVIEKVSSNNSLNFDRDVICRVINSAYNLNELVRTVADFGAINGVGDFLGV